MVTRKMDIAAKSIAAIPVMRTRHHDRFGSAGMQILLFSKWILDKYTKTLNYQFDYTALIFLEQAAGWKEQEQAQEQMVSVTCNLLFYCIRNNSRSDHFMNTVLHRQITPYLENNLELLKQTASAEGRELGRYYQQYQRLEQEIYNNENLQQRYVLLDQIREFLAHYEQNHNSSIRIQQDTYRLHMTPASMSQAFFTNLYHCFQENRIMNYWQLWKWQNRQQLKRYALGRQMQLIIQEPDMQKKEQQLIFLLQQYGSVSIEEYLKNVSRDQYENVLQVLYELADIDSDSGQTRTSEMIVPGQDAVVSVIDGSLKDEETSSVFLEEEHYETISQELVFAQYQKTEEEIERILQNSDEITQNFLKEKVEEYKERFFDFININTPDEENVSIISISNGEDHMSTVENPEIFSNDEIRILLHTVETQDSSREFSKQKFVQKKLNLIAWREVTEQFLAEDRFILQTACLERITQLLQPISFQATSFEEISSKGGLCVSELESDIQELFTYGSLKERKIYYQGMEQAVDEMLISLREQGRQPAELQRLLYLKEQLLLTAEGQYRTEQEEDWRFLLVKETGENILKAAAQLSESEKEYIKQEMLSHVIQKPAAQLQLGEPEKKYTEQEITSHVSELESDIQELFTYGSLEERKIYYQGMEQAVDEMLISLREQGRQPAELQRLLYLKEQLLLTAEGQYRTEQEENWRFLLVKETRENILKAAAQLSGPEKEYIKQEIISKVGIPVSELESDIQEIFTYGSLEERKIYYQGMEQAVDEMLISLREQGKQTEELQRLLYLKEQLLLNVEDRHRTEQEEDWRFLLVKETGENILKAAAQLSEPEKEYIKRVILPHIIQGPASQLGEPEKKYTEQEILSHIVRRDQERGVRTLRHISREVFETRIYQLTNTARNSRQYEMRRIFQRNGGSKEPIHNLSLQDLGAVFLTQYNSDFTKPPTEEDRNRLMQRETFRTDTREEMLREYTEFILAQPSVRKEEQKKEAGHADEDERESERMSSQLEGELLDYKNELRNRTRQIQDVEKKLIDQQKELELFRESHHSMKKQIKTVSDRNRMMNQLKDGLMLERMRIGVE